jgi:hypothetical protein
MYFSPQTKNWKAPTQLELIWMLPDPDLASETLRVGYYTMQKVQKHSLSVIVSLIYAF